MKGYVSFGVPHVAYRPPATEANKAEVVEGSSVPPMDGFYVIRFMVSLWNCAQLSDLRRFVLKQLMLSSTPSSTRPDWDNCSNLEEQMQTLDAST